MVVDIATSLGYSRSAEAVRKLTFAKDTLNWCIQDKRGVLQKTMLINESGLYTLILKSKLPSAKDFQYWVTSEVLPSIRKTGSYSIKPQDYLELESLEYHMNWIYEHSNIVEIYSSSTLITLDEIEKEIKNIKDKLKKLYA